MTYSWPLGQTLDDTIQNIKNDVSAFANQHTLICLNTAPSAFKLEWDDRKTKKSASIYISGSSINVTYNDVTSSYRDFLASEYMADMNFTAQRILDMNIGEGIFINQYATYNDKDDLLSNIIDDAVDISSAIRNGKDELLFCETTKIFFIRGQAGSGKTVAMQQLAKETARNFINGICDYLFFYIDAQGRSLSHIDEAISAVVGQYSFTFQYNAIKALTRNNLLVPIIDGFDELIGAGGFADAFCSLSSLLASLCRQGTLIATARSTFYDDKILRNAAMALSGKNSINYIINDIALKPWGTVEIDKYLCKKYNDEKIRNRISKKFHILMGRSTSALLDKPFYIVKIIEALEHSSETDDHSNYDDKWYISFILNRYIEREAEDKFKDRSGKHILPIRKHIDFLKELSLELWLQEKRTVDKDTIQSIAELILESNHTPAESWPIFIGKIPSYSFFKTVGNSNEREFENQIYFDYFLAQALISCFHEDSIVSIRQVLNRSLLDESTIDFFTIFIKDENTEYARQVFKNVLDAAVGMHIGCLAKRNAGTIVSILIQTFGFEHTIVHNLEFYGVSFKRDLYKIQFVNCYFCESKFYSRVHECIFDACKAFSIYTDAGSSFADSKFINNTFFSLTNYARISESHNHLSELGGIFEKTAQLPEMSKTQQELFKLLVKFLSKINNRFLFDLTHEMEPFLKDILTDQRWSELLSILLSSGVLVKKDMDRSGNRQFLYMFSESKNDLLASIEDPSYSTTARIDKFVKLFWDIA